MDDEEMALESALFPWLDMECQDEECEQVNHRPCPDCGVQYGHDRDCPQLEGETDNDEDEDD